MDHYHIQPHPYLTVLLSDDQYGYKTPFSYKDFHLEIWELHPKEWDFLLPKKLILLHWELLPFKVLAQQGTRGRRQHTPEACQEAKHESSVGGSQKNPPHPFEKEFVESHFQES